MRQYLHLGYVGFVDLGVLRIVLDNLQRFFQRGLGNEDSSDPILNETTGKRHDGISLDGLRHYRA